MPSGMSNESASPSFSSVGVVVGEKLSDGSYKTHLSFKEMAEFFKEKTAVPILEIEFEEDEGFDYLRAYDGKKNIYRLLEKDATGSLRLTALGGDCEGTICRDCTKSGLRCICDDTIGDDSDCKEFNAQNFGQ